jgi:hypothetical protein
MAGMPRGCLAVEYECVRDRTAEAVGLQEELAEWEWLGVHE